MNYVRDQASNAIGGNRLRVRVDEVELPRDI